QSAVDLCGAHTERDGDTDHRCKYGEHVNNNAHRAVDLISQYRPQSFGKQPAVPFSELGVSECQSYSTVHAPRMCAPMENGGPDGFKNGLLSLGIGCGKADILCNGFGSSVESIPHPHTGSEHLGKPGTRAEVRFMMRFAELQFLYGAEDKEDVEECHG